MANIENGRRAVDKRSVLEALAAALRVAPSELAGQPIPRSDQLSSGAHAGIVAVEAALSDYELGQPANTPVRPWDSVLADIHRLNTDILPRCDYVAMGLVVSRLIPDLHASYNSDPENRRHALEGMMHVYRAARNLTYFQGIQGLPQLAALHARRAAEELGEPHWLGLATWIKINAAAGSSRARNYDLMLNALDDLEPHMDSPEVAQVYGMLHLYGALVEATREDRSGTDDHLDEAAAVAHRLPDDVNLFAHMYFGRTNVDIWRVGLGVELGDGAKVAEAARRVHLESMPSLERQGMFYADLGRGLASDKRTRPQAVAALAKAEKIAPQRMQGNPFFRETVIDLVRKAKHDSVGRELRGMAYRMGVNACPFRVEVRRDSSRSTTCPSGLWRRPWQTGGGCSLATHHSTNQRTPPMRIRKAPAPPPAPTIPVCLVADLQAVVTTAVQIYHSLEMGLLNPAEVERLERLETSVLRTCHRLLAEQITRATARTGTP